MIGISTALAALGLAATVAAVVLFLLPRSVRVPNSAGQGSVVAQDCGTPAMFLLDGRADQPTRHLTRREARSYIAGDPCSELVADRAVPGGGLLAGAFVISLAGFTLAWIGHRTERRRHHEASVAAWAAAAPQGPADRAD